MNPNTRSIERYAHFTPPPVQCSGCNHVTCIPCSRSFTSIRGLSIHLRSAHESQYNQPETLGEPIHHRWQPGDLLELATCEVKLRKEGVKFINQALQRQFPNKTLESIKGVRNKKAEYKDLIQRLMDSAPPSAPTDSTTTTDCTPSTSVVRSLRSRTTYSNSSPSTSVTRSLRSRAAVPQVPTNPPSDLVQNPAAEALRDAIDTELLKDKSTDSPWDWSFALSQDGVAKITRRIIPPIVRSQRTRPDQSHQPQVTVPPTRKQLRRRNYGITQQAFRKDRKKLYTSIIAGTSMTNQQPTVEVVQHWMKAFNPPIPEHQEIRAEENHQQLDILLTPVTVDDIVKTLAKKSSGAAGPDNWSWKKIKDLNPKILASLFNLWLLAEAPPAHLVEGCTTLIPKKEKPTLPSDFRPITVTSCFLRLFHAILGDRMEKYLPISSRQKGFRTGDGLFANNILLRGAISDSKTRCKNLRVAFLDMKNAFGSVTHKSITDSCQRLGVPLKLINYIDNVYKASTTRIRQGNTLTEPVNVSAGVLQGDPLSVHLFNAVIDTCTNCLDTTINYTTPDKNTPVTFLAYADDLVLLAKSDAGLRMNTKLILDALAKCGLQPNPLKSASMSILARKGKFINPSNTILKFNNTPVPAVGIKQTYKYLGAPVGIATTELPGALEKLTQDLERLTKAPLQPQQRLFLLREHLLPSLEHKLLLTNTRPRLLKSIDHTIRSAVKRWLAIKVKPSNSIIHSNIRDGGLGVPSLRTRIPALRNRRITKLLTIDDQVPSELLTAKDLTTPMFENQLAGTTDQVNNIWKEKLYASVDGAGLQYHQEVPKAHNWLREPTRLLTGRDFIRCVHLRYRLLMTNVLRHRMNANADTRCQACLMPRQDLAHTIQTCFRAHAARIKRHNTIQNYLATKAQKKGYAVIAEPVISTSSGNLKPDLLLWKPDSDECLVVDVAICADNIPLAEAYMHKLNKYNTPQVIDHVKRATHCHRVTVGAAILNWRGAWCGRSTVLLRDIISGEDIKLLAVRCTQYGVYAYDIYNKSTAVEPSQRIHALGSQRAHDV